MYAPRTRGAGKGSLSRMLRHRRLLTFLRKVVLAPITIAFTSVIMGIGAFWGVLAAAVAVVPVHGAYALSILLGTILVSFGLVAGLFTLSIRASMRIDRYLERGPSRSTHSLLLGMFVTKVRDFERALYRDGTMDGPYRNDVQRALEQVRFPIDESMGFFTQYRLARRIDRDIASVVFDGPSTVAQYVAAIEQEKVLAVQREREAAIVAECDQHAAARRSEDDAMREAAESELRFPLTLEQAVAMSTRPDAQARANALRARAQAGRLPADLERALTAAPDLALDDERVDQFHEIAHVADEVFQDHR